MTGSNSQFIADIEAEMMMKNHNSASMIERVSAAIEDAMDQRDDQLDLEFIIQAQLLLAKLYGSDFAITTEQTEESFAAAKAKLKKKLRRKNLAKRTVTIAAIAATLIIALFAGDLAAKKESIRGESTEDEQKYFFVGTKQEAGIVESGIAAGPEDDDQIRTPHLSEAVSILGVTPPMPTWYPDGWEVEEYYAFVGPTGSSLMVVVTNEDENQILAFDWVQYSDVEYAYGGYEQSYHGEYRNINGWEVYFTENIDYKVAIWIDGSTSYSAGGPASISWEDLVKIIESIDR